MSWFKHVIFILDVFCVVTYITYFLQ